MQVEVVDGEIVEPPQALVGQHLGGQGVQLGEVVLRVAAVVWLQDLRQEEHAVGLGGEENSGLLGLGTHFNQI